MHVTVPDPLRQKLADDGSLALVQMFDEASRVMRDDFLEAATGRFERRLTEEIGKLRIEMATLRSDLRQEMATGLAGLREEMARGFAEVRAAIAESRADTIKWTFIFWTGQFVALAGFLSILLGAGIAR